MVTLRRARSAEAEQLSELCLRSKAVWGYDAGFLSACRDQLMIAADDIASGDVHVAEMDGVIVATAHLVMGDCSAVLDKLFVDPPYMGRGIGQLLYRWAVETARRSESARLIIDADPGAVGFYSRMGAVEVGQVPSTAEPGRLIPRLLACLL